MPEKPRTLAGVALVSAQILALELILTRFFSISQGYHYAFLVVSLAFLGFGAGSLFLFSGHLRKFLERAEALALLALVSGLVVPLVFFLVNRLPFNPLELLWDQARLFILPIHYLILSLPFLLGGLIISLALTRLAGVVHRVYFADLTGAAAGIIFSALSFRLAGDRGAIWLLVLLPLAASWLFIPWASLARSGKVKQILGTVLIISALALCGKELSFRISDYKSLAFFLKQKGVALTATRWDEKTRLDLFESPAVRYAPGLSLNYNGPLPEQTGLSLDAERIYALNDKGQPAFLDYLPLWAAFEFNRGGRFLLLNPAGDLELLLSLKAEASLITIFIESQLLGEVHRDRIGQLRRTGQSATSVQLITVEPRAGLNQERKRKAEFDLLVYPLPDLPGSYSTGFFGPGEDYLMTAEAVDLIYELLSPRGLVTALFYFLPPPRQELRFLALWVEGLERRGLRPERHIVFLRTPETITYLIKKQAFTQEDISRLKKFADHRLYDLIIPGQEIRVDSRPSIQTDRRAWEELAGWLFDHEKRQALYSNYIFDIRPPDDNRPFFRDFMEWKRWPDIRKFFNRKAYPLFLGKYLLVFLLIQSLALGLLVIVLPLLRSARRLLPQVAGKSLAFFYFASLGAGYMLVEITLFHKFILLIGHPTYSLSAVLFFLLGASGAGSLSLASLRRKTGQAGLVYWPLLCLLVILLVTALLELFGGIFLGLGLAWRLLLCLLLVFPLGFCLGIPFPAGLGHFQSRSPLMIPFAFAANAFFSLLASVWGLVQAQISGYRSVFFVSAGCYLLAFLFFYLAHHRDKPDVE
ncbi:MAG: hypothetical protein OP8BY_0293 [Candidatus Saccharicenans subterraneus]|uniref:Spermidine synthase n=1 Tax=Candidatus Saccharicenans subterraneus TaxID=2508984 RepID=A0A3E2BKX9_9BACT|nr:MAG: hypothetical protein OP8BY_0293 [Candidatus Saccharicenans subterraneum]